MAHSIRGNIKEEIIRAQEPKQNLKEKHGDTSGSSEGAMSTLKEILIRKSTMATK